MNNVKYMALTVQKESARFWYYPFLKGVGMNCDAGLTVRNFLHTVLRFDHATIEKEVRTIFLNNSPVDDIDKDCLSDNDSLALGSAMPGLVGIVMGRDNPYKSFREDITSAISPQAAGKGVIQVSVKLFSSLAKERAPAILSRGVFLHSKLLAQFLEDKTDMIIGCDDMDGTEFLQWLQASCRTVAVCVCFV